MPRPRLAVILVLALVTPLAGCDWGALVSAPPAEEIITDYFPVEEGEAWFFETEHAFSGARLELATRTRGMTTWTFTEITPRPDGRQSIRVTEAFEGIAEREKSLLDPTWIITDTVQTSKTLTFSRSESDSLDLANYAFGLIPARYPLTAPDTVRTQIRGGGSFLQDRTQVLVRGRGVARLTTFSRQGAGGGSRSTELVRVDSVGHSQTRP
ncbi:MAG: hypothetical protein AAGI71_16255 [Bacteroidota bacterium]